MIQEKQIEKKIDEVTKAFNSTPCHNNVEIKGRAVMMGIILGLEWALEVLPPDNIYWKRVKFDKAINLGLAFGERIGPKIEE